MTVKLIKPSNSIIAEKWHQASMLEPNVTVQVQKMEEVKTEDISTYIANLIKLFVEFEFFN